MSNRSTNNETIKKVTTTGDKHDALNDYRLVKLNAYQGQQSWEFTGRNGSHGRYSFPYHGMKVLERKE